MKRVLVPLLKLTVAVALIVWLVQQGKLDFKQLKIFLDEPVVLAWNVTLWLGGYVLLGALRWWVLLRGVNLNVPYRRAAALQLIGLFFNTAMPGAVGGDIVKAYYVVREQQAERKTPAMVTVVLDRIVGLVSLFLLAGFAVVANYEFALGSRALSAYSGLIGLGVLGILVGSAIVFFPHKEGKDPFELLLSRKLPGFALLKRVYDALRCYRGQPLRLTAVVVCTMFVQAFAMFYFLDLTTRLVGFTPDLPTFATVYPLGLLASAVPLAPGGMVVGHLAFEQLYASVGWSGGANVFNVYALGTLALNLLGVVPYLLYRSEIKAI